AQASHSRLGGRSGRELTRPYPAPANRLKPPRTRPREAFFVITVIGSANLDLIATVERLPRPGETVPGDGFSTAPGGKGANQALAARRAGADVRMAGAVGQDAFADQALALLQEGGVDLSRMRRAETATGIAVILVEAAGENVIAIVPGGNGTVSPS